MKSAARMLARLLVRPSALAGGFVGAAIVAAQPGGTGLHGLVLGWLYGLIVGGLIRSFRVPPGAFPLVGLCAGPVPFALCMPIEASAEERGLVWVGVVVGLILGCMEWAHARREARESAAGQVPTHNV